VSRGRKKKKKRGECAQGQAGFYSKILGREKEFGNRGFVPHLLAREEREEWGTVDSPTALTRRTKKEVNSLL